VTKQPNHSHLDARRAMGGRTWVAAVVAAVLLVGGYTTLVDAQVKTSFTVGL